jgi:hypothetical protein
MDSSDEKIIALSKTKIVLAILGTGTFVAIGAWFLLLDDEIIRTSSSYRLLFNEPMYARGLGIAAIVIFGALELFFIKKLFDKKPGLVFNNSGIIDNASAVAAGFIPWSEITGYDIFEMPQQKMLIIMVSEPQKYVERGNAVKQKLNQANFKMCGSPISISANALEVNFPELISTFQQYQQKYGRLSPVDSND